MVDFLLLEVLGVSLVLFVEVCVHAEEDEEDEEQSSDESSGE